MADRAKADLSRTTIHNFPHAFINKRARPILVSPLTEDRHAELLKMHLAYRPRNSFSGLPPLTDRACTDWAQGMIDTGVNLVALSFTRGVVGHAALFSIDRSVCEYMVVVRPRFQKIGIGTELTRCVIQLAGELDFEKIVLHVETRNVVARHVYEKCGFRQDSDPAAGEIDMSFDLALRRSATEAVVRDVMNTRVASVHPETPCKIPLMVFLADNVAAVPVTDPQGKVTGILSMSDLLVEANIHKMVRDVQTRGVVTLHETEPLSKAICLFQSWKLRCIPVVDARGNLVGVVDRRDVLAHYMDRCAGSVRRAET